MGDQSAEGPGPSTVGVAGELNDVRRRGLPEVNGDSRRPATAAPTLEAMARALADSRGRAPASSRPALLGAFLEQALQSFQDHGNERDARFIRQLFFDPAGEAKIAKELKADAMEAFKLRTEDMFLGWRRSSFDAFAEFLIRTYWPGVAEPPSEAHGLDVAASDSDTPPDGGRDPQQADPVRELEPAAASSSPARDREPTLDDEIQHPVGKGLPPQARWGIAAGIVALAAAVVVVILVVANSGSSGGQAGATTTSSSAAISVEGTSSASGAADQVFMTFDSLGSAGSNVIQVYAGPSDSPGDRQPTGTYMSGATMPVACQAKGRPVSSDTSAGEPDRTLDVWLQLAGPPGPPQFATLTYASIDPAALARLRTCG